VYWDCHPATAIRVLELNMGALLDRDYPAQPSERMDDLSSGDSRQRRHQVTVFGTCDTEELHQGSIATDH